MKRASYLLSIAAAYFFLLTLNIVAQTGQPQINGLSFNGPVLGVGDTAVFSVNATGAPPLSYQWQLNGTNLFDNSHIMGSRTNQITITNLVVGDSGDYSVIVANTAGSAQSSKVTLTVSQAPIIRSQTVSNNVVQGMDASFFVTATGEQPLMYQWLFGSTPLAGETNPTLALTDVQPNQAGSYFIIVSNSYGSVTGLMATLTVQGYPIVSINPTNLTVVQGDSTNFTGIVSGSGPFTYQWELDGEPVEDYPGFISGSQSNVLQLSNIQQYEAGEYTLVVTDTNGLVSEASANLFVNAPPYIYSYPYDQTILIGDTAYFYVAASGMTPFTYQWYRDGIALSDGGNVSGSHSQELVISNAQLTNSADYSVIITDTNGLTASATANLLVEDFTVELYFQTMAGFASEGSANGAGSAARFFFPAAVASDSSGNLIVADLANNSIRMVTPDGIVTTIAGHPGNPGSSDGLGSAAQFNSPQGLAVNSSGQIFVADGENNAIRLITKSGTNWLVSTIAGDAETSGSADGAGPNARFDSPEGIAVDPSGRVFVADSGNHTIRMLVFDGTNWMVTTIAGLPRSSGSADGAGSSARFNNPRGIAVGPSGALYVADTDNSTVRKITSGPTSWTVGTLAGSAGQFGFTDATGSSARFYYPGSLVVDSSGNVYVSDTYNFTVRLVTQAGVVTTIAGLAGNPGSSDGAGGFARFNYAVGIGIGPQGNLFLADSYNHCIRKCTTAGLVTTLAGVSGVGAADGFGSSARFNYPQGICVDSDFNVYVADSVNDTIRKITQYGTVTTIAGLPRNPGSADGEASGSRFYFPGAVAVDKSGNLYVADTFNCTIRKLTPFGSSYTVSTIAGAVGVPGSVDGPGASARFNYPGGIAVDCNGYVYVADTYNSTIRVLYTNSIGWEVQTIAGHPGSPGLTDGYSDISRLNYPGGLGVNSSGEVFVADTYNFRIRMVEYDGEDGYTTTVDARTPQGGTTLFDYPLGVAVDRDNNLYVSDTYSHLVWKLLDMGTNWVASSIAGEVDSAGYADGIGSGALFAWPSGIAVDKNGYIYVADTVNQVIREGYEIDVPIDPNQPGPSLPPQVPSTPPTLKIARAGNNLILSWPVSAIGYMLETSNGLGAGANWQSITSGVATVGNNYQLTNSVNPGAAAVYFRLHHP